MKFQQFVYCVRVSNILHIVYGFLTVCILCMDVRNSNSFCIVYGLTIFEICMDLCNLYGFLTVVYGIWIITVVYSVWIYNSLCIVNEFMINCSLHRILKAAGSVPWVYSMADKNQSIH
jgi:hypothetical protein